MNAEDFEPVTIRDLSQRVNASVWWAVLMEPDSDTVVGKTVDFIVKDGESPDFIRRHACFLLDLDPNRFTALRGTEGNGESDFYEYIDPAMGPEAKMWLYIQAPTDPYLLLVNADAADLEVGEGG